MSFSEDVEIDKHALDEEWLEQARLFSKYSSLHADAMFERDKAKERLALIKAQIDHDIRQDPESYGFAGKPTEPAIASLIVQDDRYQEAINNHLVAQKDMNIISGTRTAMEHKKSALEVLAKLYLSGYFAEVRIPQEARKQYKTEEETKALNESPRLKRRKEKR